MPSSNVRRVKNRIKHNLFRIVQLRAESNYNEECLRLLNESLRNLVRIRSQMNEDKFNQVKNSIDQLMDIVITENPSLNTYAYYANRDRSGK